MRVLSNCTQSLIKIPLRDSKKISQIKKYLPEKEKEKIIYRCYFNEDNREKGYIF